MKKIIKRIINNFFNKKLLMIANSHILNIRSKYPEISKINDLDYKIFSQNGEDGIIDYLLTSLKIENPKFVEIGVGDYLESNTRYIFERTSSKGLIIDCIEEFQKKVSNNFKLWKGDLTIVQTFVNSENILEILKKNNFTNDLDLFSLDVDGIDYWILKKLPNNFSKIAVIEYNSVYGPNIEVTVPNKPQFNRTEYHYSNLCFGVSLKALINLMNLKGFVFLGSNLTRCNAFFVSHEYLKNINLEIIDINKLNKHTDSNIRESRDLNGKLSYLSGINKIKEIFDCEVIDLTDNNLKKIRNL